MSERLIGKASKQMQVRMVYILPTDRINIPAEISAIRITLIKHGFAFLDEVTQLRPFFLVYIKRRLDVANKAYSPLSFKIETSLLLLWSEVCSYISTRSYQNYDDILENPQLG